MKYLEMIPKPTTGENVYVKFVVSNLKVSHGRRACDCSLTDISDKDCSYLLKIINKYAFVCNYL